MLCRINSNQFDDLRTTFAPLFAICFEATLTKFTGTIYTGLFSDLPLFIVIVWKDNQNRKPKEPWGVARFVKRAKVGTRPNDDSREEIVAGLLWFYDTQYYCKLLRSVTCCLERDVISQTDGNNQQAHQEVRKRHTCHKVKRRDTHASTNPHKTAQHNIPSCGD